MKNLGIRKLKSTSSSLAIWGVFTALPLAAGAAAPQSQFENPVPTTISPEAQAFIRGLHDPSTYPAMPEATDLEGWRKVQAAQEERSKPAMDAIRQQYRPAIANGRYGGVPVLDIQPNGYKKDSRVIVFVHGGGYVMNSAASSLAGSVPLATDTGIRVVSVDYTLAPFATYGAMLDQVIAVVDALLKDGHKPRNIAMVGVSAGGGLVAGSALKMRDQGREPVAALILWSPAADLTMRGETVTTLRRYEPAFDVSKMGGLLDTVVPASERKNPYVSPVFGNFSNGYPPTLIQGGTREALLSGFVQLYQAIDSQGGTAKLDIYEGMVHTFQEIRPELPESKLARRKDADFLRHYLKP